MATQAPLTVASMNLSDLFSSLMPARGVVASLLTLDSRQVVPSPPLIELGGGVLGSIGSLSYDLFHGASTVQLSASQAWDLTSPASVSANVEGRDSIALTKSGAAALTLAGVNSLNGGLVISAGSVVLSSSADQTIYGPVSGSGSLTKSGAGALILLGQGSLSGGLAISAGSVSLAGGGTYSGPISGAAPLCAGSLDVTLSGANTFTGTLVAAGTSNVVLSGSNTATAYTVGGAAVAISKGIVLGGTDALPNGSTVSVTGQGTFVTGLYISNSVAAGCAGATISCNCSSGRAGVSVGNNASFDGDIATSSGINILQICMGDLSTLNGDITTVANQIVAFRADIGTNADSSKCSVTNSAGSGNKRVISGVISGISGTGQVSSNSNVWWQFTGVSTFSGGSLNIQSVWEVAGAGRLSATPYSGAVTLNGASTSFVYSSSVDYELSGAIGGAGTVVVGGSGLLTFSGTNNYTGTTTVNSGGRLTISSAAGLGTGATAVNGTLNLTASLTGTRTVTVNSGGVINKNGFAHTGTTFVNNGGTINA